MKLRRGDAAWIDETETENCPERAAPAWCLAGCSIRSGPAARFGVFTRWRGQSRANIDGDGRAAYAVTRNGKAILAPSKLGFLFTDAVKIDRRLSVTGQEVQRF